MQLEAIALLIRDTPTVVSETQLEALVKAWVDLARIRCGLRRSLAERRAQYLYPQEKGKTDLDRKTMLEGATADIEHDYDFAVQLEDIMSTRFSFLVVEEVRGANSD